MKEHEHIDSEHSRIFVRVRMKMKIPGQKLRDVAIFKQGTENVSGAHYLIRSGFSKSNSSRKVGIFMVEFRPSKLRLWTIAIKLPIFEN